MGIRSDFIAASLAAAISAVSGAGLGLAITPDVCRHDRSCYKSFDQKYGASMLSGALLLGGLGALGALAARGKFDKPAP